MITLSPGLVGKRGRGAKLAVASAILVGVSFVMLGEASDDDTLSARQLLGIVGVISGISLMVLG